MGIRISEFVFLAEYITAIEDYKTQYIPMGSPVHIEAQPNAYHLEAGYNFSIVDHATLFSVAYSGTDDLQGYLPESRLAMGLGIELFEGLSLGLEFIHDEDYEESKGGTGESANGFLTQLAYEF